MKAKGHGCRMCSQKSTKAFIEHVMGIDGSDR